MYTQIAYFLSKEILTADFWSFVEEGLLDIDLKTNTYCQWEIKNTIEEKMVLFTELLNRSGIVQFDFPDFRNVIGDEVWRVVYERCRGVACWRRMKKHPRGLAYKMYMLEAIMSRVTQELESKNDTFTAVKVNGVMVVKKASAILY